MLVLCVQVLVIVDRLHGSLASIANCNSSGVLIYAANMIMISTSEVLPRLADYQRLLHGGLVAIIELTMLLDSLIMAVKCIRASQPTQPT